MEVEFDDLVQGKDQRVLSDSVSGSIHEDNSEVSVSLRKGASEKAVTDMYPSLYSAVVADDTSG